jgi:DNA (cytosine-5)-methyltransferase 1
MHKGMNTTVDEGQTPIVTTGGAFDEATCFKPSHFTRGKDGKPSDVTPPLSADADKGDQDTVVCATGQRTHALTTRAACEEDGTGRGNPIVPAEAVGFNWQNGGGYGKANDGLGITEEGTGPLQRCNTPAVAFTAKDYGGEATAELSPTMRAMQHVDGNANAGGQLAVAFTQNQREKDGVVPALTNPGGGGRADAVNVCLPAPQGDQSIAFNAYQRTEGDATWPIGASDGRKVEVGVRSGMQVRRLTPSECEYLQGFPAGHTDIVFRKKPAADGPRYRALGNSMAVPCMVWLGHRIQQATKGDNT